MTKSTASIAEVLFGPLDKKTTLDDDKLRPVLLDQYKVYVEMADRISARRQIANTYALSINSALIALVGYFGLVTVWFRSLAFHYATFASKAKGLMPPRYEWRLRTL